MAYTYSAALITTLRASIDFNFKLINDTVLRDNLRKALFGLIGQYAGEFSDITSEA